MQVKPSTAFFTDPTSVIKHFPGPLHRYIPRGVGLDSRNRAGQVFKDGEQKNEGRKGKNRKKKMLF
jgi:hypothetical protein